MHISASTKARPRPAWAAQSRRRKEAKAQRNSMHFLCVFASLRLRDIDASRLTRVSSGIIFALLALATSQLFAGNQDAFTTQFQKFANEHCVECHGPDLQKSKLRLDNLPLTLDDKDIAATWVKVHDKLARGEMPPKKKPRPPVKDLNAVIGALHGQLQEASLSRQQQEGRVILRRLNRTEYETTLRDLLGTQVEVKDLLPDDNSAAGFDNVSAALDISPVHLLRYQEAAEAAIVTVIPNRPPTVIKDHRTGRQITEKLKSWNDALGKFARVD